MPSPSVQQRILEGQDACRRGDADLAREIFEHLARERQSGEVLEGVAQARHLGADYVGAMTAYERAYAAYRREGNLLGAARAARTLGWFHGSVYGEWAVFGGWVARARTLLEQAGDGGNEHGWVLLAEAQGGSDLHEQERLYRAAIDVARRCGDGDLECEALASLGIMLVFSGLPRGMRHLDEALATVCAGEVGDLSVAEGVLCGLFHVCERTCDVVRAEQWLRVAEEFSRSRRLPSIRGLLPGLLRGHPRGRRQVARGRGGADGGTARLTHPPGTSRSAPTSSAGSPTCACARAGRRRPHSC